MKQMVIIGSGNVAEALVHGISAQSSQERVADGVNTQSRKDIPADGIGVQGSRVILTDRVGAQSRTEIPTDEVGAEDRSEPQEHRIVQIFARNAERGQLLATRAACSWTDRPEELARVDLYLIAVSDREIGALSEQLDFGNAVVAHTAGSVEMEVLSQKIRNRGVFYPLQTFTQGRKINLREVPFFLEAENEETFAALSQLARSLSEKVYPADSHQRATLHLSAVFACNFTNHLYAVAQEILRQEGIPTDAINALIAETTAKALETPDASRVQTGPAVRNDTVVCQKQLRMLAGDTELQTIYETISKHIWETSKRR